jgi:glucose-6-phosphate 1-dehydrogenase
MEEQSLQVSSTGMAPGTPPDACVVVIFGVAGDLGRHTLIPSLYSLGYQGLMPKPCAIIGVARRDWDDDTFRDQMQGFARHHHLYTDDHWQQFARNLYFVSGELSSAPSEMYAALHDRIAQIQGECRIPDNVLFHLSIPPKLYGETIGKCAAASLLTSDRGWRRVIIEKPFGHDEASARQLDRQLLEVIQEEQLYRVDHYLGKETVQNMLAFRFGNPGFEPIWNRNYIDHVQITVAEEGGIGTRAGYYDTIGVVRDMVQNHLLQLLCMTAIEPPVGYDGTSLRNETFKVLQAARSLDIQHDCVLGQYGAGKSDTGEALRAYRDEENVPADSTTPTYVALKIMLDSWRWAGVPFYLRTGKRLPAKLAEINIHFKPTPCLMFPIAEGEPLHNNILVFRLQPDEGILHTFLAKQPGAGMRLRPVTMHFRYDAAFGIKELPSAYEWLLHDAMHGDQTLFPRSDWIYKAWSLMDPLIAYWDEAASPASLPNYEAGSWGPAEADRLLERDGREWHVV